MTAINNSERQYEKDDRHRDRFDRDDDRTLTKLVIDVGYIREDVEKINSNLEKDYVTQDQFKPVRSVVYWGLGVMGTVIITITLAVLQLILK